MLKAIILEDEQIHLEALKEKIHDFCPDIEIVATFLSCHEALEQVPFVNFDMMFLDVRLGDMTAFDFLSKLRSYDFHIIFVSAFDEYALNAFRLNAVDYLLKPVDGKELRMAVRKAMLQHLSHEISTNLSFDYHLARYQSLSISDSKSLFFVPISDIYYCQSDSNYTDIFYQSDTAVVCHNDSKNLLYFEKKLGPLGFIRIHQSVLVNYQKVVKVTRTTNEIILQNNYKFPIARQRKQEVIRQLKFFNQAV
jgi:two-component system LytT family response regulator